jgi:hypothetical protein
MIIETITNPSHFYEWLVKSDSYKKNFSYKGAKVVQEFMENLSEETGKDIEFDPIAWCCEFSEYDSMEEIKRDYNIKTMEELENNTMVLSDNPIVIQEF